MVSSFLKLLCSWALIGFVAPAILFDSSTLLFNRPKVEAQCSVREYAYSTTDTFDITSLNQISVDFWISLDSYRYGCTPANDSFSFSFTDNIMNVTVIYFAEKISMSVAGTIGNSFPVPAPQATSDSFHFYFDMAYTTQPEPTLTLHLCIYHPFLGPSSLCPNTINISPTNGNSFTPFNFEYIGGNVNYTQFPTFRMNELRVWSQIMDPDTIRTLYAQGNEANLLRLYRFDDQGYFSQTNSIPDVTGLGSALSTTGISNSNFVTSSSLSKTTNFPPVNTINRLLTPGQIFSAGFFWVNPQTRIDPMTIQFNPANVAKICSVASFAPNGLQSALRDFDCKSVPIVPLNTPAMSLVVIPTPKSCNATTTLTYSSALTSDTLLTFNLQYTQKANPLMINSSVGMVEQHFDFQGPVFGIFGPISSPNSLLFSYDLSNLNLTCQNGIVSFVGFNSSTTDMNYGIFRLSCKTEMTRGSGKLKFSFCLMNYVDFFETLPAVIQKVNFGEDDHQLVIEGSNFGTPHTFDAGNFTIFQNGSSNQFGCNFTVNQSTNEALYCTPEKTVEYGQKYSIQFTLAGTQLSYEFMINRPIPATPSACAAGYIGADCRIPIAAIIVPIIVVIVAIVAVLIIMFLLRRRRQQGGEEYAPLLNTDKKLILPTPSPSTLSKNGTKYLGKVEIGNQIGEGHFGRVFKGTWAGTNVALKQIKNPSLYAAFEEEATILNRLNHTNIVRLFGLTRKNDFLWVVMEFVGSGSLDNIVAEKHILVPQLCHMAHQIASGMMYLHGEKIIHRDLALRNILAQESGPDYIVKISDFGLSKHLEQDYYSGSSSGAVPVRWSAPEVIARRKFYFESDVWSFGVTLWELFSEAKMPYTYLANLEVSKFVTEEKGILEKPKNCPDLVWDLIKRCFQFEYKERPKFDEIHRLSSSWLEPKLIVKYEN